MTWTTARPTKAGWYWWRTHAKDGKPWVIKVQQMWRIGCDSPAIIGEGGEWQGPIEPEE